MIKKLLLALPLLLCACPSSSSTAGEGEGEGSLGEGEGEGNLGEGEGEGDLGEGEGEGEGDLGEGEGEGDLGEGEGEGEACAIQPLCSTPPSQNLTFTTGALPSVLVGDGAQLLIGSTTRTNVEDVLGVGIADTTGFRVTYCSAGVQVQYVDADGTISTDGGPSPIDVVARVLTLPGALGSVGGLTLGGQLPAAAPVGGAFVPVGDGTIALFHDNGYSVLADSDRNIVSVTLFRSPGAPGAWTLPLSLDSDAQSLGDLSTGDFSFAEAEAVLGSNFDAEGELDAGFVNVFIRVYASTGIRLAGICQGGCDANDTVGQIALSPPFLGQTAAGIRLGSSRAQLEATLSDSSGTDQMGAIIYGTPSLFGDPALGVFYFEDGQCTERVVALAFNPPPSN